jgi:hypothetical protein
MADKSTTNDTDVSRERLAELLNLTYAQNPTLSEAGC